MMNRWRSYRLWVAIASLISLFLQDCGVIDVDYDIYTELILSILVLLGIIRPPGADVPPPFENKKEGNQKDGKSTTTKSKGFKRKNRK
ncbi:hypothetical protein [Pontibacillus yanchengensis]|uniref:hypothetical protein n=1 Tax=Pontibacillus yanchengensis TaxID=462910 RepID=UPI001F348E87|nr:hypothetical protein [Pontibacillus yanchengensis]